MMPPPTRDDTLGGVPVSELAATYGTPLHVIDVDEFELEVDRFMTAFGRRAITVGYAAKAFLCIALAELIAQTPLRIDVCSLGELLTAERGGVPAARLYFHGCGKTNAELAAIVERRVAFNVIDNTEELETLAGLAGATTPADAQPVDVMLRINTGIEAHTHEFIRTGGENTKFGIPGADVSAVLHRLKALPQLRLVGLHAHIGSNISDAAPFIANVKVLVERAHQARDLGHPVEELIAGGGLGVEAMPSQARPFDLDGFAAQLELQARDSGFRLAIEPGRALIARAGSTLYRIVAVKSQNVRRFIIVDGGMADNPRPAIYGAYHHLDIMRSAATAAAQPATLCGRSCENDELGAVSVATDVRAGDLVALRTTGAYTYSMASNYNRFGRPPVIFVRDGSHRRVIRGERPEDVLRNDLA